MTNERKGFSGETLFGGKNSLLATEKVRKLLSKPPKRILTGREFIEKIKAGKSKLICVGDMVTLTAINGGVVPSLAVFDGKTERNKINVKTINRTYDKKIIEEKINEIRSNFDKPIVTEVKRLDKFYEAEDYHRDYYAKNPLNPYCTIVIGSKIHRIKKKYASLLRD